MQWIIILAGVCMIVVALATVRSASDSDQVFAFILLCAAVITIGYGTGIIDIHTIREALSVRTGGSE